MSFSYTTGVPNPPNNPSVDVTPMQTNTNSISSLISVDHVGFNIANGGTHKQVNFSNKTTQGAQADPASVLFTTNGTASANAELIYKNASGSFPLNTLRVLGSFLTVNGTMAVPLINGFNVTSINSVASVLYNVVVPNGIITGSNICVFISLNNNIVPPTWTWTSGTNTLAITVGSTTGKQVSFSIYQV